ncbi:MAG: ABC transporter substrate-binding protein [Rhodospirillales bacterium]|nr:ABC transporter substrate-binding protein [Rhodospirillales bacterium]
MPPCFNDSLRPVKPFSLAAVLFLAGLAWGWPNQARAADILRLGFVTSQSDVAAHRGQDFLEGFKLGLRMLGGRLGGVETDLAVIDDVSRPQTAAQAARKLVEREHVQIISGPVLPQTALAVAEAVKGENGPLFVSPAFGPVSLAGADCRQGFFSLVPSDEVIAEATARQMKGEMPLPMAAALIPKKSERERRQAESLRPHFSGLTILETGPGNLVFDHPLQALQASKAQAVAVYLGGGVGIGFLRQLKAWELNKDKTIYADWPLMEPLHLTAAGDAGISLKTVAPWADDPENAVNHRFVADYEDEHRRQPSGFAALGYDLALLLDQAVKNMGGRLGERTQFARALTNSQLQGTRGPIRFANNHFALTPLHLREGMRDAKGRLIAAHRGAVVNPADRHAGACRLSPPEPPPAEEASPPKKKR